MPVPLIWLGVSALTGGVLGFGAATATNSLLKYAIIAAVAWFVWSQYLKPTMGA